jgi:hypothetical protein
MRRRGALLVLAWVSGFVWLGCNALLGIESAVFEPDGGVGSGVETGGPVDEGGTSDGSSSDASADAVVHPCTSTLTDPFNCGACGHDCLGGGCSAGRCEPFIIATDPGQPMALAVDATHVYWTNATTGDVRRAPITGGPAQTLFDGPTGVDLGDGLVRAGADVYFTIGDADGGVFRCPATGCGAGGPVPVVAPLDTPQFVGLGDGGVLLFTEGTFSGRVGRCTLPCASPAEFVAGAEGFPRFVAGDNGSVYWSTLIPGGGNLRTGVGVQTTLVSGQAVQQVEVNGGEVLFAARGSGVKGVPSGGGTPRRLYEPLTQTERFAVDGTLIYFNDSTSSGRIIRCPLVGCGDGGVTMATSQNRPYAIAVDKTSIFWTNFGDGNAGSVVRLAK